MPKRLTTKQPAQQKAKVQPPRTHQATLDAVIQREADVEIGPPVEGAIPPGVALRLQQILGNKAVRALLGFDKPAAEEDALQHEGGLEQTGQESEGPEEDPKAAFTREKIDQIVSEVIAETLTAYNNIPVVVKEEKPAPEADDAETATNTEEVALAPDPDETGSSNSNETPADVPADAATDASDTDGESLPQNDRPAEEKKTTTVTKKLKVRAVYYINPGNDEIKADREAAGFKNISKALGDQLSELNGKNGRLSAGRAVTYGKASPEDLGLFIDKALAQGSVHKYGRQEGKLGEGDLLVDMDDGALQGLIQDWMYAVRAGVDCTGLANIALIRAREEVRDRMREAGVPEEELPRELARRQRPAKGKEVKKASDLRPGDIWVTNNGAHVRLVMEVGEGTNPKGKAVIVFSTAESATGDALGPTDKRWRTRSLSKIQKIRNIEGGGTRDGNFYRVKESRKKRK